MSFSSDISSYFNFLGFKFLNDFAISSIDFYLRESYRHATAIVVPSPFIGQKCQTLFQSTIIQSFEELDPQKYNQLLWIPYAIDTNIFHIAEKEKSQIKLQLCQEYQLDPSRQIVLWVSRIAPEKNPERWHRLMLQAISYNYLIEAIAIGTGPLLIDFQNESHPHIHWIGEVPNNNVALWMQIADIFLFPSTVETFSNVIMESVACGCQAIIAHEPNHFLLGDLQIETIEKNKYEYGWTINTDCDIDWFNAFDECYHNPILNRTNRFIENHYSRDIIYSDYNMLYQKLVS